MDFRNQGTQTVSGNHLLSKLHRTGGEQGGQLLPIQILFAAVWLSFPMLGACFVLILGSSLLLRMVMWVILPHLLFNIPCRRAVFFQTKCGGFGTPKWNLYWPKVLSVGFHQLSLILSNIFSISKMSGGWLSLLIWYNWIHLYDINITKWRVWIT